jgi:DNA-binding transcriptional MocR family regulator
MATQRLSQLHKRILQWLVADHQRTKGFILSSHEELVKALPRDKGTISRSLRLVEARGWIVIGRSPGWQSAPSHAHPRGAEKGCRSGKKLALRDNGPMNKWLQDAEGSLHRLILPVGKVG